MVESMHDIAGHIDNILEELPHAHILNGDEKSKIKNILEMYYREKDRKRCCDRRKILLYMTNSLHHQINGKIDRLLMTLSEIQRILYLGEDFRTAKNILRLHNCCGSRVYSTMEN